MHKFSIITPSFNQAEFLEETILSVLNQSYTNIEYIIIDGGSTDGSVEIIKKYEKHLTYWESKKDNGQTEAINKGFQKATGEIITWLNSDDILLPGVLNKVADYFLKSEASLICGKAILFGVNHKEIIKAPEKEDFRLKCLSGMPFPQPSSFFKRSILEKIGYLDTSLHYGMDYDLFSKITLNYNTLPVEDIFTKYRLHDNSKSNHHYSFAVEWQKVFSKILRSLNAYRAIEDMKYLKLYHNETTTHSISKEINAHEVEKIFLYFLKYQIHWLYEATELVSVRKIIKFIKKRNKIFYQNNNLSKIYLRSRIFSPAQLTKIRKITRQ